MSWKNACEVNPGVKVNLWLVNPRVNLSMEQLALSLQGWYFLKTRYVLSQLSVVCAVSVMGWRVWCVLMLWGLTHTLGSHC